MNKSWYSLTLLLAALLLFPSGPAQAAVAHSFDLPDTTLASNTVIEIIEHNGGIWLATGQGLNFSLDGGNTWLLYTDENGLNSDDISALFSHNGRLWVAGAYSEIVSGASVTFSDTLMYTDNNGDLFLEVDMSEGGVPVPEAFGPQHTIFDISGGDAQGDTWVTFSAFAGALLGSRDGGNSWRRLYASTSDSTIFAAFYNNTLGDQLPQRLRHFSCVVDTTHGDSVYLWAGTADGITQYVFAPAYRKLGSRYITDIVYCDSCDTSDSTRMFLGGRSGLSRASIFGQPFLSGFEPALYENAVTTAMIEVDGRLFVGVADDPEVGSTGLLEYVDGGQTVVEVLNDTSTFIGTDRVINDFELMNGRLYAAAQNSGLLVSPDTGQTWAQIWPDNTQVEGAAINVVWAVHALADTLRVGTDTGLVTLYMDPTGVIDSSRVDVFTDNPNISGARVIDIEVQIFDDTAGTFDSLAIWTINRPVTANGENNVFRLIEVEFEGDTIWQPTSHQQGPETHAITFYGDTVFAVGSAGLRWSDGLEAQNPWNPSNIFRVRDSTSSLQLDNDTITALLIIGDTAFVGSSNGFAITHDFPSTFADPNNFKIFRPNLDTLAADFVIRHGPTTSGGQIPGSFIPSMGYQVVDSDPLGRIWVSARPAFAGEETGITVGRFALPNPVTGNFDLIWDRAFDGQFAWNFGFNGDTVFMAADTVGLLMSDDVPEYDVWDTIPIVDAGDQFLIDPGTPVYDVTVIGNELWLGTDQATVVMDLNTLRGDKSLFYVDSLSPASEVYAFPVPYRVSSENGVDFHFQVEAASDVTLEIYDAAMNLVYRVLDNESLPRAIYHGRNSGIPSWDGRNGNGDKVAVGVYYFKVEASSGDARWGKLAVIP